MCNSNAMCGVCKSTNVVEIYVVTPPKPSGPPPCARFRNDDGSKAHGNHYLTTIWGAKKFGMRAHGTESDVAFAILTFLSRNIYT